MRAGGDRGRGRPHAASVTRAQARGGGARVALAAKRCSGARGKEEREEGEREKENRDLRRRSRRAVRKKRGGFGRRLKSDDRTMEKLGGD